MGLLQGPRMRSNWRWRVIGTSYESAIEDEEWKWSPFYLLLRDFYRLSAYLPRPWKHTAEEWHVIQEFITTKFLWSKLLYVCSNIVVALQCTWKLHFSENITDVDLNTLSQRLEHVSQEKEFVSNLLRVQGLLLRDQCNPIWTPSLTERHLEEISEPSIWISRKQQILANDIAFFKAPSETPGHQDVMKRVWKELSEIAHDVIFNHHHDPENFKDMWIRGCPKNKQEMLMKKWKSRFFDSFHNICGKCIINLS
jgi:hypothetical protein